MYVIETDIQHVGVRGMHWGQRKAETSLAPAGSRNLGTAKPTKQEVGYILAAFGSRKAATIVGGSGLTTKKLAVTMVLNGVAGYTVVKGVGGYLIRQNDRSRENKVLANRKIKTVASATA